MLIQYVEISNRNEVEGFKYCNTNKLILLNNDPIPSTTGSQSWFLILVFRDSPTGFYLSGGFVLTKSVEIIRIVQVIYMYRECY